MLKKLLKREIVITIVSVLFISIVFIGVSYSFFKVENKGDTNSISFGDISLKICVDSKCDSELDSLDNVLGVSVKDGVSTHNPIYPSSDPVSSSDWDSLDSYTFTLTNNGSLPTYISIILNKTSVSDITYNSEVYSGEADDNVIKVAIGESGSNPTIMLYSDTLDSNNNHVISKNVYLDVNEEKTFNLYAWLVEEVSDDESDQIKHNLNQGKIFVSELLVKSEYLPE